MFFVIIIIHAYFIHISQGDVEMHLRCGGIYNNHNIANCPQSVPVKKFLKSVNNWWSHRQKYSVTFFTAHRVIMTWCSASYCHSVSVTVRVRVRLELIVKALTGHLWRPKPQRYPHQSAVPCWASASLQSADRAWNDPLHQQRWTQNMHRSPSGNYAAELVQKMQPIWKNGMSVTADIASNKQ